MDSKNDFKAVDHEKGSDSDAAYGQEHTIETGETNQLHRGLKSRHMQMIAIGGSIGAGLFVGAGSALSTGGPGSLLIGFLLTGLMLLCTVQALGELAVLYPVNGAFFNYGVRFLDPAWGFAMGWDYAIGWLTVLPFELVTASLTISYWRDDINPGVWVTVFLVALIVVQFFGVRGYGEVEFWLALIKVTACIGFIILAVVIDCGGVPTDTRGYIGAHYWHEPGAFRNGFKGFASVFVTAAFAFGGTEMVGLAAAEAADPRKSLPTATKQVFWRISFFYIISLFLVGLTVPSDSEQLLGASSSATKDSPFVLAITMAGIKGLPSVMNAVITISVLSVANSCTYGSTRTIQALATQGMAPKIFAKVDKHGRPIACIILQLLFGFLAYITEAASSSDVFTWLLSLSGLAYFFVWGSICLSHIRFRAGWKAQGHSLKELPYQAQFGVAGSYVGLFLIVIALIATFYVALFPVGSPPDAKNFFEQYLAAVVTIILYLGWKAYTRGKGGLFVRASDMDLLTGMRALEYDEQDHEEKTWANLPKRFARGLF